MGLDRAETTEIDNADQARPQRRFDDKSAKVGIIGLGYVGLPLALLFARKGFTVTGFDVDSAKVKKLHGGETYIRHISAESIAKEISNKRFSATDDFSQLEKVDACIVCVPTPLDEHREPDLSFVRDTASSISRHLQRGQLRSRPAG